MEIRMTIPKEFEDHFNFDHFKDSLGRIAYDLSEYIKLRDTNIDVLPLSGNYEQELAYVLPKMFARSDSRQLFHKSLLNAIDNRLIKCYI